MPPSRAVLPATLALAALFLASGCASVARRSQDAVRADIASGDRQRAQDAFSTALAQGWVPLAEQARSAGAGLDTPSSDGIPPIVYAAENDRLDLVRWLLKEGAEVEPAFKPWPWTGTYDQVSYLEIAGKREMAALLREARAARTRRAPGNLDDEAYARLRQSAAPPGAKTAPVSDIDAPARRGPERPADFALVVGIEEYQSLPKADHGVRDARAAPRHFEALGIPARNIVSLEGSQATASKLKSYLEEWLPRNLKPESTLFVYYSGHGAPDPQSGDAYLVPWDGDPKFLKSTAYPLKTLYAGLAKLPAKRVVVALDACFSGAGGRSVLAQGARPLVAKVADSVPESDKLVVLAAASGDEITGAIDAQGHGLFTYYFLKGLSGDARDASGAVTPKSLYGYLLPRVQDEARRQNREQTPVLSGASLSEPLDR